MSVGAVSVAVVSIEVVVSVGDEPIFTEPSILYVTSTGLSVGLFVGIVVGLDVKTSENIASRALIK